MKLNIIIEVKDSKFSPFKFVVVQSGKSAPNLHTVCQKGNLKPEYKLCTSMYSPEF